MRYRRVSGEFWLDARVRALPEDGRWAFLYLLTHPAMTAVGAMRATLPGLAAELGWRVSRLQRALAPAIEQGMVEVNADATYVGLPKFLKHNPPESLNVVRAWVKALGFVPDCPEKRGLIIRCREYLRAREQAGELKQGFAEVFAQALAQGKVQAFALQSAIPETGAGGTTPEQETGAGGISPTPLISPPALDGNGRRTARAVKLEPMP